MNLKDAIVPYGEDIAIRSDDSILSILYRRVLKDSGIDKGRFLVCIEKYAIRTTPIEDAKEISSIKGNLYKELMRSVMTWKVFIKGLQVINIQAFDMGLNAKMKREVVDNAPEEVAVLRHVIIDPKLTKKDKDIVKMDEVLSTLFRDIMHAGNVNTNLFTKLLAEYIIRANIPTNIKEVSSTRGNLKKELFKSAITWKVFIKGLMFLRVLRFEIAIYVQHFNGKTTAHYANVNLDAFYGNEE